MLIVSPVMSKASGSLAGLVASHNKGGMYLRQRSTPINPNTSFQQDVRNIVKLLASNWSNVLTQAQRNAWSVYAANQPLTNVFGESKLVPPLSQYIRANTARIQSGLAIVNAGPVTFTLPAFTDPAISIVASTGISSVVFTNTDNWAGEVGGFMSLYTSRPQSVGVNFFKGPYRLFDTIEGSVVPPVSPNTGVVPFLGAAGSKYFIRAVVGRADGRMSSERFYTVIAS